MERNVNQTAGALALLMVVSACTAGAIDAESEAAQSDDATDGTMGADGTMSAGGTMSTGDAMNTGGSMTTGGTMSTGDENSTDSTDITLPIDTPTSNESEPDDTEVCFGQNTPIVIRPAHLMLLLDSSLSMEPQPADSSKWDIAKDAIVNMVATYSDRIQFGLDAFPAGDSRTPAPGYSNAYCKVGQSVIEEIGNNSSSSFASTLELLAPQGLTPLCLATERYLDPAHSTTFPGPEASNYLVIISDGGDTCKTDGTNNSESAVTPEILTDLVIQLREERDIRSIAIGFGGAVNGAQLNAIASSGGSEFQEYLVADENNPESLNSALSAIAESVVPCDYNFGDLDPADVDFENVRMMFDGVEIPYNEDCAVLDESSWEWADEAHTTVRLCDAACNQLKQGSVTEVSSTMGCPPTQVVVVR